MPPRKVLRRSHRKSRLGCQECKRRHIKVRNGILSAGTCIYSGSIGNTKNADSSSAMRHSPRARIARAMIAPARICSGYQTHLNAQSPANRRMLLPNQHHQDLTQPGPGRKVYRAQWSTAIRRHQPQSLPWICVSSLRHRRHRMAQTSLSACDICSCSATSSTRLCQASKKRGRSTMGKHVPLCQRFCQSHIPCTNFWPFPPRI